ncbi:MAG: endospore germination permease [Clostridiales bacterium]|nr:endospore germination permease [Clostridiales bacterium]
MKVENAKISATQFMFSIVIFIRSSSLLSAFFFSITKQDSWLIVLFGTVVCIPLLWVYVALAKQYPDKSLIQINDEVFGRIGGKIVSVFYIWFFFTLTTLNLRDLGGFVNKSIMILTPNTVIISIFIILCAWSVYYGLEVVTRYSIVFTIISTAILIVSILATFNIMNFENFLPIFHQPVNSYIHGTHIISTIPFGELVVFLMIAPNVEGKEKGLAKYFYGGFFIAALLILLVILRDTAVLGNMLEFLSLPSFEALRLATLFETISHIEILFAVLLILFLFFKISILFYTSILAVSHFFKIKSYRPLILPASALIVVYSITIFENVIMHTTISRGTAPFFWAFIEMILPFITLMVSYIKKAIKKAAGSSKEASAA